MLVYDYHILQNQGREWLEVYAVECDLSVKLFIDSLYDLVCNACLHCRSLQCERYSKDCCCQGNNDKPEYFQYTSDSRKVLFLQLAKIVKISEKIRIFATGYAKHIIYHLWQI